MNSTAPDKVTNKTFSSYLKEHLPIPHKFIDWSMKVALFLWKVGDTLTFSWDYYGHQGGTGLSVLAFAFRYRSTGSLYLCHLEVHESMPLAFPVNK